MALKATKAEVWVAINIDLVEGDSRRVAWAISLASSDGTL